MSSCCHCLEAEHGPCHQRREAARARVVIAKLLLAVTLKVTEVPESKLGKSAAKMSHLNLGFLCFRC